MPHSLLVAIAIVAMDGIAILITDPSLASSRSNEIEGAAGSCQHSTYMRTSPCSFKYYRSHLVARLVAEMQFDPLSMADRESVRIDSAHLPVAMTCCSDQQRYHLARFQMLWGTLTNACRIEPMRFR